MSRGNLTGMEILEKVSRLESGKNKKKHYGKHVFVSYPSRKLTKHTFCILCFPHFLSSTMWCLKSCCYSQDEISRKRFGGVKKFVKNVKKLIFTVFFIIERWFFKGIQRKTKKVKTVFASILIPNRILLKTKTQNIQNHRIQFITKITIFRKIKKPCNTKIFWK